MPASTQPIASQQMVHAPALPAGLESSAKNHVGRGGEMMMIVLMMIILLMIMMMLIMLMMIILMIIIMMIDLKNVMRMGIGKTILNIMTLMNTIIYQSKVLH